ncbi:hypothetical protein [Streptomyces sp. NPDC004267]|uniref:hypothetical protein n=1 Tax=Streptomyces sp. NPDC004267 TaxID=3364694 RepID=UPI0036745C9A
MTTSTAEAASAALVAALRGPLQNALAERADTIRQALPARPEGPEERLAWLQALGQEDARQAALLDRLDALCAHLAGRPALGYPADVPIPEAALEEAEGFVDAEVAALITAYRKRSAEPFQSIESSHDCDEDSGGCD